MESNFNSDNKTVSLERVVGIIFLIPPILGVIFFVLNVFVNNIGEIPQLYNLSGDWTGRVDYSRDGGGGGYTSAAPIYLGLMAIAGAILLKDSKK